LLLRLVLLVVPWRWRSVKGTHFRLWVAAAARGLKVPLRKLSARYREQLQRAAVVAQLLPSCSTQRDASMSHKRSIRFAPPLHSGAPSYHRFFRQQRLLVGRYNTTTAAAAASIIRGKTQLSISTSPWRSVLPPAASARQVVRYEVATVATRTRAQPKNRDQETKKTKR
jgi:hypothetical protein